MKSLLLTVFVAFFSFSGTLKAQFEGEIRMNLYSEDENGKRSINNINLYATADRILIQGAESVNLNEAITAQGLLIRNDSRDFIVMMDGSKALQFTKADLEATFRMFSRMGSENNNSRTTEEDLSVNYYYTNEVRTIRGFEATELRMDKEDEEGYLSIWLTPEIKLNWGMLAEPWLDVPRNLRSTADRISQEFKSSNFPVLIEAHNPKENKTQTILDIESVDQNSMAKAMVQVPPGMNLVGLNELMFMLMMGN